MRMRKQTNPKVAVLRRVPFLQGCTDDQLRTIEPLVDEVTLPAGRELTSEGASAREAFVIVEGWAAVMIGGEPVAALGPGEVVGEMAMLDRGERTAAVVAKTPMVVLVVGPKAFDAFVAHPAVARGLSKTLVRRLRQVDAERTPGSEA